jgi:ferredoxin
MNVSIDPARCQGKARCFNMYPSIFAKGENGKGAVIYVGELESEHMIVDAQSAANACPLGAIKISDD